MATATLNEPVSTGNGLPGAMPILSLVNGHPRASSLAVAEHFKKRHDNVLRMVTQTRHNLPKEFDALNFEAVEYTDPKGENRPFYLMTRDGFALIVMGFTGKEAMAWKLRYIEAFNAMEAELARQQTPPTPTIPATLTTSSRLSIQNLIAAKVSHYPSELRPKAFKEAWSRVKNKFQVAKYEEIPQAVYPDAVAYILAMEMRTALPAAEVPKALPPAFDPERPLYRENRTIHELAPEKIRQARQALEKSFTHFQGVAFDVRRQVENALMGGPHRTMDLPDVAVARFLRALGYAHDSAWAGWRLMDETLDGIGLLSRLMV